MLRTRIAAAGKENRQKWSNRICDELAHWISRLNDVRVIATYAALETEVDLAPLHSSLQDNYQFAYPLVVGKTLQFHLVPDPAELRTGAYGIPEPNPRIHPPAGPGELNLCLCPGLGFTLAGVRLGRGKAYYDSVLPFFPATTFRIGIAFKLQVEDTLPREAHDILMSHLGTEEGIRPTRATSS